MKLIVVYREESDRARPVLDYLADFKRQTGRDIQTLDPESAEGAEFCRLYDIVEYPTLLALSDDGQLQNLWRGLPLPTISEASYYG